MPAERIRRTAARWPSRTTLGSRRPETGRAARPSIPTDHGPYASPGDRSDGRERWFCFADRVEIGVESVQDGRQRLSMELGGPRVGFGGCAAALSPTLAESRPTS
jgi:hypothetical protein